MAKRGAARIPARSHHDTAMSDVASWRMALVLAALPIVVLLVLIMSPWPRRWLPMPAHGALLLAALLAYGIQVVFIQAGNAGEASSRMIHAAVIDGVLTALTPLAIVFGAVLLFKTLEISGAMGVLTARLRVLSPDPVAQLVLVGWAFSFLIEGLSGFGTPAALAAPVLVGLGFPPVRVAAMCLIMNSVPVPFGAVGTPVWFGLGELDLSPEQLLSIGFKSAAINAAAALLIPLLALRVVLPWSVIRPRLRFVYLVILATVTPFAITALWSVEFPSIIGGVAGLLIGSAAARLGLGLPTHDAHSPETKPNSQTQPRLCLAVLPLLGVLVILAATRIGQVGIKGLLTSDHPAARASLGALGEAWISPSLVIGLRDILGTGFAWKMPLLYVPFILPFVVVSLAAIPILRMDRAKVAGVWRETIDRLARPAAALVGALVLVKMFMLGNDHAPAMLIGQAMAQASGSSWALVAPLLGALGSFFSGSNTVSNLTFAPVQAAAADSLSLNLTGLLALQTVGGAMGNMVCIHNIVAVAAVLGLRDATALSAVPTIDGDSPDPGGVAAILRLTAGPMAAYALIAAAVGGLAMAV